MDAIRPPEGFSDWDDAARAMGATAEGELVQRTIAARTSKKSIDWPLSHPLPGGLPAVPVFAAELMPDALRPWIADIVDRMQCPMDFPAVATIVTLSSLVGRQCAIRPKRHDDWTVVPNLWGAVVGRPGVLKTPAIQEPIRILSRLESAARQEFEAAQTENAAAEMISKAAFKVAQDKIAAAMKGGDTRKAEQLAREAQDRVLRPPTRQRYITSDATVEKLGELLNENPRGILLFRDELVGWLLSLEREGREGSRQFFLESWNGDGRFTFDRIGRGTVEIEAAAVSVFGGIQPGPLADYLRSAARGGTGDDGMVQRLQLLVWPDVRGEFVNVDRWPDTTAKEAAWQVFQRLDRLRETFVGCVGSPTNESGTLELPFLRFCDEAQEVFDEWRIALEVRLRSGLLAPSMESHLAKYRSLVPSLALLFHLIDSDTGSVALPPLVRALAWAEYLEGHAQRVYSTVANPELDAARELLRHIRAGDLCDGFTAREVYLKGWKGLDSDSTHKALAVLTDTGHIRWRKLDTGGRPKQEFDINPRGLA
jgi:hypothetical protein